MSKLVVTGFCLAKPSSLFFRNFFSHQFDDVIYVCEVVVAKIPLQNVENRNMPTFFSPLKNIRKVQLWLLLMDFFLLLNLFVAPIKISVWPSQIFYVFRLIFQHHEHVVLKSNDQIIFFFFKKFTSHPDLRLVVEKRVGYIWVPEILIDDWFHKVNMMLNMFLVFGEQIK